VEKLKRKASIAEVRVNPFLFTFEAKDFVLEEADNRPIIGFDRLFVDFQLSSLFRWAWTFADVRIERPSLHIEIQHNGRLNFADLADSLPKSEDPPPTDSRPPRLLVHHAEIIGGSFTFSDRSDTTHAHETFWPLNLEFKEISTLPERKGPYTVKADLPGGGTVGWQGEISLHPIFSEGKLSMAGFKLATAWKFAQDELNLAEPAGEVDFSTRYRFDYQERTPLLVLQDAKFALKGLLLTEKGKKTPLLDLQAIEVDNMRFDLQTRELMVPNIVVRDGKVAAAVDEKGLFDWQKLVARRESTDVTAPISETSTPESQPWRLKVKEVKVENVAVDYSDHSRANPLALAVGGLNVLLNASAEVGTGPVKAMVEDLEVALNRVSISEAGDDTPFLSLDTLALNDGRIDIGSREITITRVGATGGGTSVIRGKNGRIRLLEMLNPKDKGRLKRDIAETGMKARAEGKPWSFSLDTFEMNGFQVALLDNTFAPAIVYDLKDIRASVKNLTNDGKTPIDFKTNLKVAQGGSVNVSGQVSQVGDRADARAKITGINLKPLGPAAAKFTLLALESGNISASARVKYRSAKSGPQLHANGLVKVNTLMLTEEGTGERFLEFKEMSVNGLKFGLSPDRLQIEEVRLLEPGAKVVIFKDRSINLAKMLKPSDAVDAETATNIEKAPAVVPSKDRALFPVSIERVRVEKGVVDFADFSLVLPFATHVTDFSGGATGISSDAASRTTVNLEGKVDEYGFTTVEGRLSPFAPKSFTDLTVKFQNVDMKPLSPYSATFAGRKIASGTLNIKLEYKIQNSELLGENEVLLEQFTLGDRVEAPNAINLPLDLAIALLTDTEGKIDVAVPVSGNVDNPKFSYGHVIRQALVNLITKVVTAPFGALGGLLGDKGEQMDAISFQPGSDRLLPPELKKLKNVAEALEKRPQLRLVVQGRFDTKIDGEALRTERVKRALAEQMGVKLSPNEEPGPVAFNNAKTQKALEKLLKSRAGDKAITDFKTQYEKETGQKAKRVKPYLALFGWESSDIAFYQEIFEELVKLEPLLENDLQDLAQRRAEAIVKELRSGAGLDPTRVTAGSSGPVKKASTDTVNTSLTLDVIKPAA
jgi:outer membrane protein OmpA-like peptidoglycan-associated protein